MNLRPHYIIFLLHCCYSNISILHVSSNIRDAQSAVVSCSNVQTSYCSILWKSRCILALASLPWHPCLNQCECISGRKPSAPLSIAAAFIFCSCRQIQEYDALSVTCKKICCVLVCVLESLLRSLPDVTHSFMTVAI